MCSVAFMAALLFSSGLTLDLFRLNSELVGYCRPQASIHAPPAVHIPAPK